MSASPTKDQIEARVCLVLVPILGAVLWPVAFHAYSNHFSNSQHWGIYAGILVAAFLGMLAAMDELTTWVYVVVGFGIILYPAIVLGLYAVHFGTFILTSLAFDAFVPKSTPTGASAQPDHVDVSA